jgi:hypothetical protein
VATWPVAAQTKVPSSAVSLSRCNYGWIIGVGRAVYESISISQISRGGVAIAFIFRTWSHSIGRAGTGHIESKERREETQESENLMSRGGGVKISFCQLQLQRMLVGRKEVVHTPDE